MQIMSPQEREMLWGRTVAARGQDREVLRHELARAMFDEFHSDFDLYSGFDEPFDASIALLDHCGRFGDQDLLRTFQSVPTDEEGPSRLLVTISARLREIADDERCLADQRALAGRFSTLWRGVIADTVHDEMLTVSQVAGRFGVSVQAVYKWVNEHKIEYQRSPGGRKIRIPAAQFDENDETRPVGEVPVTRPGAESRLASRLSAIADREPSRARDELGVGGAVDVREQFTRGYISAGASDEAPSPDVPVARSLGQPFEGQVFA
jgi:excisionase family DNA binding protein